MSKTSYYADFVIYAMMVCVLTAGTVLRDDTHAVLVWLLAALAGAATWTLIEYLLHRFVLHRIALFVALHDVHHRAPKAFVGTPTWFSMGILVGAIFLPAWAASSLNVAIGFTTGVMTGFFWYGAVHHIIHHRRPRALAVRLVTTIHRHLEHHYSALPGNYGVTSLFWDRVFGTTLPERRERTARPLGGAAGDLL